MHGDIVMLCISVPTWKELFHFFVGLKKTVLITMPKSQNIPSVFDCRTDSQKRQEAGLCPQYVEKTQNQNCWYEKESGTWAKGTEFMIELSLELPTCPTSQNALRCSQTDVSGMDVQDVIVYLKQTQISGKTRLAETGKEEGRY